MSKNLQPWYRQFWPWFLIALPATAVCASLYTVYLAASDPPALVVDDYSRIGLANKQNLQLDNYASQFNLQAALSIGEGDAPTLSVSLSGNLPENPESLVLKLAHPTLAELDQRLTLVAAEGQYVGVLPARQARYYVQLEPTNGLWRLSGQMLANSTVVMLAPRDQK